MARQAIQNANASLYFNGSSSVVTVATPATGLSSLVSSFTVGGWINNVGLRTDFPVILQLWGGGGNPTGMQVYIGFGQRLVVKAKIGGTQYDNNVSTPILPKGSWVHVAVTFDGTTLTGYVNGVLSASVVTVGGSVATTNNEIKIGAAAAANWFRGNMSNMVIAPYMTAAQVLALYQSGTVPTGATAVYPLNEGAGSIAYDTSGNGNNGTITSGTWSRDTPTKTRKAVNGNMVYNGDFEIVPPFTATTTTQFRWIDGTAAGGQSAVNPNPLSWGLNTVTGTAGANYDTSIKRSGAASMKVTAGAAGSATEVKQRVNASHFSSTPVLPSTSYTLSGWVKTSISTGTATTGAYLGAVEQSFSYSNGVARTAASGIVTTQDWTYYTTTFTTASTARYLNVYMGISSDGAGTLVGDAWFDDITLTPTTPITRSAATGRLTATGRSAA